MSSLELITGIVALYGAALSTLIFVQDQQRSKRLIKINMKFGFLYYSQGLSDQMVLIDVVNPGLKTVTINGPHIRLPDGKSLIMPVPNSNVKFPYELGEGKSAHTWIEEKVLRSNLQNLGYNGLIKLKAVVMDQTGKEFKSKLSLNFKVD